MLAGVEVEAESSVSVDVEVNDALPGSPVIATVVTKGVEAGRAALNTAPTIIKFITLIVISTAPNTRLDVS